MDEPTPQVSNIVQHLKEDYDIGLLACMALTLLLLMSTAHPRSVVPAGVICRMFTDAGPMEL